MVEQQVSAAAAIAQDAAVVQDEDAIIVTASKREENIRDSALAISAVTGEALAEVNTNSLSNYIVRLPGVVFNDYQPGVSEVVIRGIAVTTYHEQGQTTVGYYINEIPVVEPGFPIGIPDVDTFDLDRVEVLCARRAHCSVRRRSAAWSTISSRPPIPARSRLPSPARSALPVTPAK